MSDKSKQRLLTAREVAERLSCSLANIRKMTSDGKIPHVRIGGLVRFEPDVIDKWLDGQRRYTSSQE